MQFTHKIQMLLVAISLGLCSVKAQPEQQTSPPPAENLILPQVVDLLEPSHHIGNVRDIAPGFRSDVNQPPYKLYIQQIKALKQTKQQKLKNLVPSLILYLDYPAIGGSSPYLPYPVAYGGEVLDTWPAYAALNEMQEDAAPVLSQFLTDGKNSWAMRLTVLQVLHQFDEEQAKKAGKLLLQVAEQTGQKGAVDRINEIIKGQKPYWGLIDFTPITFSSTEIKELLSDKKHLNDVQKVRVNEVVRQAGIQLKAVVADAPPVEETPHPNYELMLKQITAIHDAGELKMVELVPNLVLFMDYQKPNAFETLQMRVQVESRRRVYPALDALLKIGSAAIPQLTSLIEDITQKMPQRLSALSVLREIDYQKTVQVGQPLQQEIEKSGDEELLEAIKFTLKKERTMWDGLKFKPQPKTKP